jgi:hypothetical protein
MNYRIERHLKEIDVIDNNEIILKVKYRDTFLVELHINFTKRKD